MNEQTDFVNFPFTYGTQTSNHELELNDLSMNQITEMSDFGFKISIVKGRVNIKMDQEIAQKVVMDEIDTWDENKYPELLDYLEYRCWCEDVYVAELNQVFSAVEKEVELENKRSNPFPWKAVTFYDIFEYIINNWKLSESEKEELKTSRAERSEEEKHPDENLHNGQTL